MIEEAKIYQLYQRTPGLLKDYRRYLILVDFFANKSKQNSQEIRLLHAEE